MPESLVITEAWSSPRATILRVEGQLDAPSCPDLVQRCTRVKERGEGLVLNLGKVSFVASSGIGALLSLVEDFRDAGLGFHLAELSVSVTSVIKLLNLDAFLPIVGTEEEALRDLAA